MKKFTTYCSALLLFLFFPCNLALAQYEEDDEEQDDILSLPEVIEELPEGLQNREIDSLLADWQTRNYLFFDENCESTGDNPVFDAQTYAYRLSRLPNVIDMPYNSAVQRYIDLYSGRLRNSVAVLLGASNFYNPIFEEALESYQMPLELKYLPIIESALNPTAVSRAGAVGLWQFMIGTGKQYGLEVTSLIDERRDPIKASYAAARYLHDLYGIFGDWTLAIASYNCGPNNILKAIKRAGGVKDYWTIYPYLPAAIQVSRNVRMERIAELCGISQEELRKLNPQYRTTLIPGDSHACTLRMPAAAINSFIEAGDSIYVPPTEVATQIEVPVVDQPRAKKGKSSRGGKSVTVRRGDTLGAIARRNGTTVAKLKRLNGIRGNTVYAGRKIRVK